MKVGELHPDDRLAAQTDVARIARRHGERRRGAGDLHPRRRLIGNRQRIVDRSTEDEVGRREGLNLRNVEVGVVVGQAEGRFLDERHRRVEFELSAAARVFEVASRIVARGGEHRGWRAQVR